MANISKKELAITIKKANKAYGLDLAVRYFSANTKLKFFRKKNPKVTSDEMNFNDGFIWLNGYLEGYNARSEDERKEGTVIQNLRLAKKPIPYLG